MRVETRDDLLLVVFLFIATALVYLPSLHGTNLILHAMNAYFFGRLLKEQGLDGAWIAVFLFAVHPVLGESVAWLGQTARLLAVSFGLLASIFFLESSAPERLVTPSYAVAILMFIAACFTHPGVVTLPFSYLFLRTWFGGRLTCREGWKLAPFIVLALFVGCLTLKAHPLNSTVSTFQYCCFAGRAVWFYIGKLLYPHPLLYLYPPWNPAEARMSSLLPTIFVIIFGGGLAYGQKWWGKVPFAGFVFYLTSLIPFFGVVSINTTPHLMLADHYQYLASLGLFAVFGWVLARLLKVLHVPIPQPFGILVVALLCGNLAMATYQLSGTYRDALHVWEHTLSYNPRSALAHYNMGIVMTEQRDLNEAVAQLRTAEALDQTYAPTHLALARLAANSRRWNDARHQYRVAIELGIKDPLVLQELASLPAERRTHR